MTQPAPHFNLANPLIEAPELHQLLNDSQYRETLRIVDASYHIPPSPCNAFEEYQQEHLPGAVFFDIDAISDSTSALPHMLPTPKAFEAHMNRLGIENKHLVVVYDVHGMMSSPRAWWTFRVFGHNRVRVLNGGLPGWKRQGFSLESGIPEIQPAQFKAEFRAELVATGQDILAKLGHSEYQIADLRPAGRFEGTTPEPRAGLRSGHIPGSLNLPWAKLIHSDTQALQSPEVLKSILRDSGLEVEQPSICTCGSGVTACLGALALYRLGNPNAAVYDGAWAEWGGKLDWPIVQNTVNAAG